MKKYKIATGMCGPQVIKTNVIQAHDEREAVIKFLESTGEEVSEDNINKYIGHTYEHIPKPRKKKTPES